MSEPGPEHPFGLYAFNTLEQHVRESYLWDYGDYITGIVDKQGRSNFYTLNGYYVEVELSGEGDKIAAVVPLTTGDRYERMVRAIDLAHLT